jgi:predicted extracellular nuclease
MKIAKEPISLETPIGDEEDSHLGDFIEDKNAVIPVDAAIHANLKETVTRVLASLTPTTGNLIQSVAGAWASRTPAQVAVDLRQAQMAYKTADESVTSSTTVQDDDHLTFPIGASETWYAEWNLSVSGGSTGDLKVTVTMPSGATSELLVTAVATGGTTAINSVGVITSSASAEIGCGLQAGTGNRNAVTIEGVIFNDTTAGNVTLRWAQNTSDGTATTVRKGSTLIYRRLA